MISGFLAARDIDMQWWGQRFKGPKGTLLRLTGEHPRFIAEFSNREDEVILLDEQTLGELEAIRDAQAAKYAEAAARAEAARVASEAAEAERRRKAEALAELVRQAVPRAVSELA